MADDRTAYDELCAYTLAHGDPAFVHQHVVDAYAAQHAGDGTKPIGLTFALVGLYLHLVQGRTGREVQRVHTLLARQKQPWPAFPLPATRGSITAVDVMAAPPGAERDRAIDRWCASVWDAFRDSHRAVVDLLSRHGIT